MEIRGGVNRQGEQSILRLPSIVACDGKVHNESFDPPLENKFLFAEIKTCVCIAEESLGFISFRDRRPLSKGGKDIWTNVVTFADDAITEKQTGFLRMLMKLLAIPFVPNQYEFLLMQPQRACRPNGVS